MNTFGELFMIDFAFAFAFSLSSNEVLLVLTSIVLLHILVQSLE